MKYQDFKKHLQTHNCQRCPSLCNGRTNIVVDRGNPDTKLVLIGEAPGANEDKVGLAFVGRAGQLLDQMFAAIGLDTNKDLLILNMVKCRPPNNRPPTEEEVENCSQYLAWQLQNVQPNIIVLVGATAAKGFLKDPDLKISKQVGVPFGIKAYPDATFFILYHPAYLLRNPNMKNPTWEHLKALKKILDMEKVVC